MIIFKITGIMHSITGERVNAGQVHTTDGGFPGVDVLFECCPHRSPASRGPYSLHCSCSVW